MLEQEVTLPFKPYAHQRAAHLARLAFRFLVLVWHRRGGKTVFAILELILAALRCDKERGRFVYVAPKLNQAKTVAWDYLLHFTAGIPGRKENASELWVELPNGARIRLFGADNPDGMRGIYLDGVVLDEVAQMKPQVWGEIIRPCLTDRQGWALFIGTPKGVNLFSQLYFGALKGEGEGENGDGWVGWATDLRRASDTGVIPKDELEQARHEMSPQQYAQEFDCDFSAAVENSLLLLEDVLTATHRTLGEHEYNFAGKVLGVDVSRYGDDSNVLQPRQGLAAMQPSSFRGLDTMVVASRVAHAIDRWKPDATFVDGGGIGGGVVDRLQQLGFSITEVQFGGKPIDPRFENKRAEMWWEMANWVRRGGCLPNVERIKQDLTAPTYDYKNVRGKFQLESKEDMRARGLPSTDWGDALACTFFSPVVASAHRSFLSPGRNERVSPGTTVHEYDPFASENA